MGNQAELVDLERDLKTNVTRQQSLDTKEPARLGNVVDPATASNAKLRGGSNGVYQGKTDDTVTPEMRAHNKHEIELWLSRALAVAQMATNREGAYAATTQPRLYPQGELKPQFDAFCKAAPRIRDAVIDIVDARNFLMHGDPDRASIALGVAPKDADYAAQPSTKSFLATKSAGVQLDAAEPFHIGDLGPFRTEVQRLIDGDTRNFATAVFDRDVQTTLGQLARIAAWDEKFHGWTRAGPLYNTMISECATAEKNLRQALVENKPGDVKRLLDEAKESLHHFGDKDPIETLDEARKSDKQGFEIVEDVSSVLPGIGIVFNFMINETDVLLEWAGGQITNWQLATQTAGNVINALVSKFPAKGFVKGVMVEFCACFGTELNKHYADITRVFEETKDMSEQQRQTKIGIAMVDVLSKSFVEALKATVERTIESKLGNRELDENLLEAIKTLGKAVTKLGLVSWVHAKVEQLEQRLEEELKKEQAK